MCPVPDPVLAPFQAPGPVLPSNLVSVMSAEPVPSPYLIRADLILSLNLASYPIPGPAPGSTAVMTNIGRGNYVKMLFVDYSSAFNTIIPSLLTTKLEDLGLHTSLCDWISNFLTDRPQSVRVGNCASSTLTLSTGAPQGCVLSPLLYSLYTYDCTATSSSTIIVKFADDTVVMGLISDNDERAYLEEIKHLENWCQENNLLLNISKTKDLIVDCSKKQDRYYQPVRISGTTVERVDSFRYLGVHILQDLSWSRHTNSLAKKARQRLYHLRRLRYFRLPSKVLRNFYTCTIESILTGNITVWFGNSTKQDRQALQRVVHSAECITHTELPDLQTIYYKWCQTKARRIVKDPTHPNNRLFSLLRSSGICPLCVDIKLCKNIVRKGELEESLPVVSYDSESDYIVMSFAQAAMKE
ncbi:hypothetical protein P4O66_003310 [Electrophorus voltai]|uniref:Reverse transcriptase domain-containing protein n=1 Tax=Electrophorus voltai TaxID=2609070 RepID=A0AAD9DL01_9TELE|nr:hypothetical protein P4O66_003310 [Electrophorus voltai]